MHYHHLTIEERCCIREYYKKGLSYRKEVISYIEEKLLAAWSPEQISSSPVPIPMPSWRTIYRRLYDRYLLNGNTRVLRRKGKPHGVKETRGKFNKGKSIRKRDKSVCRCKEAGHWEVDTVVSGQGKSKACFATFAERKTRYYIAVKMPDRKVRMRTVMVCSESSFLRGEICPESVRLH